MFLSHQGEVTDHLKFALTFASGFEVDKQEQTDQKPDIL